MNPEMPQKPQDAFEASLTALLLGELPHEQASALHQKLAQDPELAKLYERLKHTISLVRETISSPATQTAGQPTPLKLSDQRRQKLLQHFKTVAPKEFAPPRWRPVRWLVPVGIAAALVVILGALLLPALSRSKSRGSSLAFNTWSLSKQAEPAAPAPAPERSFGFSLGLNRNGRMEQPASKGEGRFSGLPAAPPALVPPSPARPAGTAIVLPQGGELADATTTRSVADSLGQAGGTGGGVGVGSLGGGARAEAPPAEHDFALRQAYIHVPQETLNSTLVAPPPATVPPPIVMTAPAEDSRGKDTILNSTAPALAPTEATPADSPGAPRLLVQGVTTILGPKRSLMKVPGAAAAPASAEALLSPKEDGLSGGSGGGAAASAPSGPPETVAEELALRQVERLPFRQRLAEARASGQAGISQSDAEKLTKEAAGQVPGAPAQEVNLADKLVEINQDDRKALGFDWYRGNSVENKGAIKAQGGTAPSDQAGKSAGTAGFNVAAAGTANSSSYLYFDSAAQPGQANSDGDKVPILGDVPAVGRLYRIRPGAAVGGGVNANLGAPASPQDVAWGAVQAGVVANNYLGVATNYQTADMFCLAQAPTTPSSSTTISDYADTSPQCNFGTGHANPGWLWPTLPNNKPPSDATFSTDPETSRTVPIDYAKAADISHALTDLDRPKSEASRADTGGGKVHSLGVVGYYNVPTTVTNAVAAAPAESASYDRFTDNRLLGELGTDAKGASPVTKRPIVLPQATPETSLALLNNGPSVSVGQGFYYSKASPDSQRSWVRSFTVGGESLAAANQTARTPAALEDTRKPGTAEAAKTRPYFEAKRSLEELQRFRQILDGKIAYEKIDVDLPKTPMVEIVDKAVPEPTQGPTLGERLRSALGGKVERSARVKVERDQSDIAGLADRQPAPGYDPRSEEH